MSLSEREDPADEVYADVDGLPFVVAHEVMSGFGETFFISLGDGQRPVVTVPKRAGSALSNALAARSAPSTC